MSICFGSRLMLLLMSFSCLLFAEEPANSPWVEFNSSWDNAHYLGFRPANGQVPEINPPRFSWPYSLAVEGFRGELYPLQTFTLQLSRDPSFIEPEIEQQYAFNFGNILPVLENGRWFWRVGYADAGAAPTRWSAVREFQITDASIKEDRFELKQSLNRFAAMDHPRLAPSGGDWTGLAMRLTNNVITRKVFERMKVSAEKALTSDWWNNFPESDEGPRSSAKKRSAAFMAYGEDLLRVALLHKMTGDEKFAGAPERALMVAGFPRGGATSPEYNGVTDKWGTRWVYFLAYIYDWYYHDLSATQREKLLAAIDWRVQAVFGNAASWESSDGIHSQGLGGFLQSHPFENYGTVAAMLPLVVGESEAADAYGDLIMNYMIGVGSTFGSEEGWNEAGGYAFFKSAKAIRAGMVYDALLQQKTFGNQSWFDRLGEFLVHLTPPGMVRQGFGDYTQDINGSNRQGDLCKNLMMLSLLTQDAGLADIVEQLYDEGTSARKLDDVTFCLASDRLGYLPAGAKTSGISASRLFPTAGWMFAGSVSPAERKAASTDLRVTLMARPRGGYSHSYPHDGAFVLQAGGQTLAAGGGATIFADAFARHSMSHNGLMVDGKGQAFRSFHKVYPYAARPLYWKETANAVIGAVDATGGFLADPEFAKGEYSYLEEAPNEWGASNLRRWIRSFVLVPNRFFAFYDECAVAVARSTFTILVNIPTLDPVEQDFEQNLLARYVMGSVQASVFQIGSASVEHKTDRGLKVFVNPITGKDYTPFVKEAFKKRTRGLNDQDSAITRVASSIGPVKDAGFLTVFAVTPTGAVPATVTFVDSKTFTISDAQGTLTVTWDEARTGADLYIPQSSICKYAKQTEPYRLLEEPIADVLKLSDGEQPVSWMLNETFDRSNWVNRWEVETEGAAVFAGDDGLKVRVKPDTTDGTTIWLRPELPDNVVVRYRATVDAPYTNNAANLNAFLCAREADGSELQFNRRGDYPEYHEIPNYGFTFTGGSMEGWTRLRRNPGFQKISDVQKRTEWGETYEIVLMVQNGHVRTYINGEKVHDWTDPEPLPGGKFGLRTWSSNVTIHSMDIGSVQ